MIGKKQTFTIKMSNGTREVQGYPVILPGYEDIKFFLHHSLIDESFTPNKKLWTVSEASTGKCVSCYTYFCKHGSRQEAIDNALSRLAGKTQEQIKLALTRHKL